MSSRKARPGAGPPQGEPWIWHSLSLLDSPAWRARSLDCIRFVTFLEIEHLRHAGTENGKLAATYSQLVAFGITRYRIRVAIGEAEQLGLVTRDALPDDDRMVRYQLTYMPTKRRDEFGSIFWAPASDEWRRVTANQAAEIAAGAAQKRQSIKRANRLPTVEPIESVTHGGTDTVTHGGTDTVTPVEPIESKNRGKPPRRSVTPGVTPFYISGTPAPTKGDAPSALSNGHAKQQRGSGAAKGRDDMPADPASAPSKAASKKLAPRRASKTGRPPAGRSTP